MYYTYYIGGIEPHEEMLSEALDDRKFSGSRRTIYVHKFCVSGKDTEGTQDLTDTDRQGSSLL